MKKIVKALYSKLTGIEWAVLLMIVVSVIFVGVVFAMADEDDLALKIQYVGDKTQGREIGELREIVKQHEIRLKLLEK